MKKKAKELSDKLEDLGDHLSYEKTDSLIPYRLDGEQEEYISLRKNAWKGDSEIDLPESERKKYLSGLQDKLRGKEEEEAIKIIQKEYSSGKLSRWGANQMFEGLKYQ